MKEAAVNISRQDVKWIEKAFGYVLTNALNSLALKDI